jgi:homotetrameric cytidine deaminase
MNWKLLEHRAYTPYSQKPETCIIKGKSGKYYPGVRIENVSFPLTIPAIQAACCICLADSDIPDTVLLKDEEYPEQLDFWVKEFDLKKVIKPNIEEIELGDPFVYIDSSEVESELIGLLSDAITIHSDFPVSTLLLTSEGYVSGVNIEVSDWTNGLCAERLAIAKAICYGIEEFESMYLHTLKGEFSSPCGACRQVIHEHLPDNEINFYHADGTLSVHYTNDLLPLSFSSTSLTK